MAETTVLQVQGMTCGGESLLSMSAINALHDPS